MADQLKQRQVPFLAPVINRMMAPIVAPIAETARRALDSMVIEVPCPRCEEACALWERESRLLYHVARDGALGLPLSTNHRENVPVRCDRCNRTYHTSGSAVGYNRRNSRPLLA